MLRLKKKRLCCIIVVMLFFVSCQKEKDLDERIITPTEQQENDTT